MSLENITRQHVLDAVNKIESEGITLEPSTKYEVLISGKPYPPKEIMRYANLLANGDQTWPHPGGEPTNQYLKKFGFDIQAKNDQPEIPLTGNVWKLGCIWGRNKPNFYKMLKQYSIVIGVNTKTYAVGDLILITDGFAVQALGKVLESPKPVTDVDHLKDEFAKYEIEYESWVNVAPIEMYELKDDERFSYELVAGISRVNAPHIRNTAVEIWNDRFANYRVIRWSEKIEMPPDHLMEYDLNGRQLQNEWKGNDKIIFWQNGTNAGCYALGVVYRMLPNKKTVLIDVEADLLKEPLLWEKIRHIKGLAPFSDNTIDSSNPSPEIRKQYKILLNLISDRENIMNNNADLSLNTILYGPPGTGKTYQLNQYKEDYFIDRAVTQSQEELLKEKVNAYPFWKIIGAVLGAAGKPLNVGEIVEHPMIKAWINPVVKAKPNSIVWRELQSYANDESTQLESKYRRAVKIFHKSGESKWSIADDKQSDLANIIGQELLDLATDASPIVSTSTTTINRYSFITFHQKYSYEDFIEGIKPLLAKEEEAEASGELQFELKKGLFYASCLEALKLVGYNSFKECHDDAIENRITKFEAARHNKSQQFAIFIDEINRANIAAVFGELITLLEDDKRIGGSNELWVKLPYSNEDFCVPGNLFVIGTMNTADRSIALIDIALRRRFEFKALYPDYKEGEWWTPLLESLNQAIYNWKKNPDFFIGHAFFINRPAADKLDILNRKIIPLLVEYCQNNAEMVKKILQDAGVQIRQTGLRENFQIIAE